MATNDLAVYMRKDEIKARFSEVLGDNRNAGAYIASVLLAVANGPQALQECSPASVYSAALRAATLRLSVDPSTGQAYLVPFGKNATLIVGYKGLYDMAVRTNRYRYINIGKIYEGQEVVEDPITGSLHVEGKRTGNTVIGRIGAFEMTNGFSKAIYMTSEEIHAIGAKYSKRYNSADGIWKTNPDIAEHKTVLRRLLRRYGYIDPNDAAVLDAIESEDVEIVDAATGEVDVPSLASENIEPPSNVAELTEDEIIAQMGF